MADTKPSESNYNLLGGVNEKASQYSTDQSQALNLRNLDFDVPNAWSKRPGSTQWVSPNTSGPITSLFEFIKLDGSSYLVAGSDTAMFYVAAHAYTLLDSGWTNGQPADMLTFVNKLWIANGQNFKSWNGTSAIPAGLLIQSGVVVPGGSLYQFVTTQSTHISVFGMTMQAISTGLTAGAKSILWSMYAYVRSDGYFSPASYGGITAFGTRPPSVMSPFEGQTGSGWFAATLGNYGNGVTITIDGFTAPSGHGITALGLFLYVDTFTGLTGAVTQMFLDPSGHMIAGSRPDSDPSRFLLFTLAPLGTTRLSISGVTLPWNLLSISLAPFSLMTFDWFSTYTPKYIDVNNNTMFMSGFSAAPSGVWFSELGNPEVIQPDAEIEVRTNDGDRIYGHKAFNDSVIVIKEGSLWQIIGDSADNYQLVQLSSKYGGISNNSMVEYNKAGARLIWLDRKGIVEYNGASTDIISTPVEDTFRTMNLAAAKENAVGVNHHYRNQVWFGIPVNGSTKNNLTVVYDYLVGAWTFFDGFSPSSFAFAQQSLSKPTVFRGDYSGVVHYHHESFFGDNGAGITCLAFTRFDHNKPNETWLWRRFFLDMATATGATGQVRGQVFSNYDQSTIQATFAMYQDQFQTRAEMGVMGKAAAVQFSHASASLPLLINGFSWTKRFLRSI